MYTVSDARKLAESGPSRKRGILRTALPVLFLFLFLSFPLVQRTSPQRTIRAAMNKMRRTAYAIVTEEGAFCYNGAKILNTYTCKRLQLWTSSFTQMGQHLSREFSLTFAPSTPKSL